MKGILKFLILFSIFLIAPSCHSTKKIKRAKSPTITVSTPHSVKNKLFFSPKYQQKLKTKVKRNARKNSSIFSAARSCSNAKEIKLAKRHTIRIDIPSNGRNKLYFSRKYERQLKKRVKENKTKNRR